MKRASTPSDFILPVRAITSIVLVERGPPRHCSARPRSSLCREGCERCPLPRAGPLFPSKEEVGKRLRPPLLEALEREWPSARRTSALADDLGKCAEDGASSVPTGPAFGPGLPARPPLCPPSWEDRLSQSETLPSHKLSSGERLARPDQSALGPMRGVECAIMSATLLELARVPKGPSISRRACFRYFDRKEKSLVRIRSTDSRPCCAFSGAPVGLARTSFVRASHDHR